MTIRPALASDLEAMLAIAQAEFGGSAWSPAQFRAHLEPPDPGGAHRCLLAADAGGPVCIGYVAMMVAADEAEVQSLAVIPAWRRQGVGQALLHAGVESARQRGAGHVWLEVRASNTSAQQFYRAYGFIAAGRRPGYYHAPDEAAVLMRWPPPDSAL